MKRIVIIIFSVVAIVLVTGVVAYVFSRPTEDGLKDWAEATQLPDSPLSASYRIVDNETQLTEGRAEEKNPDSASAVITEVWGTPVSGDLTDNGDNSDTALILTRDTGGSGTFYYVAAALHDTNGYLGSNAVPLGDRIAPQNISIENGMIIVNYSDRAKATPMTDSPSEAKTAYLITSGADLRLLGPFETGEQVLQGELVYGHESRTFTPCGSGTPYWIDGASRTNDALKMIYEERTAGSEAYTPMYAVLAGSIVAAPTDGFGADFENALNVRLILNAPKNGSCTHVAPVVTPSSDASTTELLP